MACYIEFSIRVKNTLNYYARGLRKKSKYSLVRRLISNFAECDLYDVELHHIENEKTKVQEISEKQHIDFYMVRF